MKRWALIDGGVVANVVEQASAPTVRGRWVECTGLAVGPGHRYVNDLWESPLAVVPQRVEMAQARLALLNAGLLASVDAVVEAMPAEVKAAAQIEWEYRTTVERDHWLVAQLGAAIGLTDAQVDALFVAAATL